MLAARFFDLYQLAETVGFFFHFFCLTLKLLNCCLDSDVARGPLLL